MQYTLTVQCGEETCANVDAESGVPALCQFVQTTHFGAPFHCGAFSPNDALKERDGWLMRNDECLKTLQKVAA